MVPLASAARRVTWRTTWLLTWGPLDLAVGLGVAALATWIGYLWVRQPSLAELLFLVPIAVWLLINRFAAAIVLALTLPLVADVTGGATGLNIAVSDVLLSFFVAALLAEWLVNNRSPELAALRPLKLVVGQYVAVMVVLFVAHLGVLELIKTGQRLELLVFPLAVGAALARKDQAVWVLRAYVAGAAVTGVLWIAHIEIGQKNPTGQFIANAILLLMASAQVRRRIWWLLPVLAAGVLWTQSRGAILSVGVGLVALFFTQQGIRKARAAVLTIPFAVMAFAVFELLPEKAQERNLSYTSADESSASWSLKIRDLYHEDAWKIINNNPGTGVGVGRYSAGSSFEGTFTTDPHQVLLLQAAEGGYLLAASFILLTVGALLVTWRMTRHTPLGPAAVAVTVAIASHGLVDVYWVRGTPVLGWMLIGMALAQRASRPRQLAEQPVDDAVLSPA